MIPKISSFGYKAASSAASHTSSSSKNINALNSLQTGQDLCSDCETRIGE
jgi:hypothetical protein